MTIEAPPPMTARFDPRSLVVVALAGTPVASLLAWVFGLGRFSVWFWRLSASPALSPSPRLAWSSRAETCFCPENRTP